MVDQSPYPEFLRVRQKFPSYRIDNVSAEVEAELDASSLRQQIQPGQTVAIAVGSRGIAQLQTIVATVIQYVQRLGGQPVIVSAMGSHGGATSEGQRSLLASLGIDSTLGCPIIANMDTVVIGKTDDDVEIHFDSVASQADHVVLINRIKPHTRLTGKYESGLVKMLMIGLGNHQGALLYHQIFGRHNYQLDRLAPKIVPIILKMIPVTLGLAIVEDAYDDVSVIQAVAPEHFLSRDPELLLVARERMPRLPFGSADLLIVDSIGKEFSGTGMDTNVIGRKAHDKFPGPNETPKIREIYVRSLTANTKGNASGIGIAEYCHHDVVQAMDKEITRINCVTAAHVTAGAIPLTFACDRDVLNAVVKQVGAEHASNKEWLWIPNTLDLEKIACSRSYQQEILDRDDLEIISDLKPLEFDHAGNLLPLC